MRTNTKAPKARAASKSAPTTTVELDADTIAKLRGILRVYGAKKSAERFIDDVIRGIVEDERSEVYIREAVLGEPYQFPSRPNPPAIEAKIARILDGEKELVQPEPTPAGGLLIPLTREDANNWSRASKAAGKLIQEWGGEILAQAAIKTRGSDPDQPSVILPPYAGNCWAVELKGEDFDRVWKASHECGIPVVEWAYRELRAAWSGNGVEA